jgi:hypothetical protein
VNGDVGDEGIHLREDTRGWYDNIKVHNITCHLGSQPIQRFVARQQLRNTQQVLEKLLGCRPRVTMEIQLEGVFYLVRAEELS